MKEIIRFIKGLIVKKNKVTVTKMYHSDELVRWSNSLVFREKSLVNDESYFQQRQDEQDIYPKSYDQCK